MNKLFHRVIFNAARGQRMAVHEAASSSSGRGRSKATMAAIAILGFHGVGAQAQIAGDPSAPGNQRPNVLGLPNGVPLVNIQTPSAAGVSRNSYRQFDVGSQGAILNNSRGRVQTQLGGWVEGNPWLALGPARVILNEVNSGNPSQLRGYVEVAGQRAEVIIANPAGIQVNGGGFINASRVTLTTGVPQFNGAGGLESLLVQGGSIGIDGAGLDASKTDYAAILARAVQVNAGIWASELKVVAGANQVSADAASVTPVAATGAAPAFALDVAQLGGMYSGKITLIGTEAGVGVRNAGSIGASAGELIVTAEGRLENLASGSLHGQRVQLGSSAQIDNSGTVEASSVDLASAGDVINRGTIRQTGAAGLSVQAPTLVNTQGATIGAEPLSGPASPQQGGQGTAPASEGGSQGGSQGVSNNGAAGGASAQPTTPVLPGRIAAGNAVRNEGGKIYAGGEISLQTRSIDNSGGSISVGELAVSGPAFLNVGGTLRVDRSFSVQTDHLDNSGGRLEAGDIRIQSTGDVLNGDGQLRAANDIQVTAGGQLQSSGSITAGRDVAIAAGSVDADAASNLGAGVRVDGSLAAQGDLSIAASGNLAALGRNLAAGAMTLRGASVDLGGSQSSASSMALVATQGNVSTRGATVVTPGALDIQANSAQAAWINDGGKAQADRLSLSTTNVLNRQGGEIVQTGAGALQISAMDGAGQAGAIDNTAGRIAGNGKDMVLAAAQITNTDGVIEHAGDGSLRMATGSYDGERAILRSNGALDVQSTGDFKQDGGQTRATQVSIQAKGLSNRGGQILQAGSGSGQSLDLQVVGTLDNAGGTIASNGAMRIGAASLSNQAGTLQTAREPQEGTAVAAGSPGMDLQISGTLDNTAQGRIAAADSVSIGAGSLDNGGSSISAASHLGVTVSAGLRNVEGTLLANGDASVAAAQVDNRRGLIASVLGRLDIVGPLDNAQGQVLAKSIRIDTGPGMVDNAQGTIASQGELNVASGSLINDAGLIQSGGNLDIDTHGQALSNRSASGYLGTGTPGSQGRGGISSSGTLGLQTGALDNEAGFIGATGALTASAASVSNTAGAALQSATSVRVDAGTGRYDNQGGQTLSGGALELSAGRIDNAAGLVQAVGTVTLAADRVDNAGTLDGVLPQAKLTSDSANSTHGIQGQGVAITAGVLDNTRGAISAQQELRITGAGSAGNLVDNSGGLLAAGKSLEIADPAALPGPGSRTLEVRNGGGVLAANELVSFKGRRLGSDGVITSGQDIAIDQQEDFANTGGIDAGRDLSIATPGKLSNSGKLTAAQSLSVSAQDIDNAASGEISAGTTTIRAAGTLTNRGLIDGNVTDIDAGTLSNIGTGRIYGGLLSIAAQAVNNLSESVNGSTAGATIAARARLDIGAKDIANRDGSLIYSDGDMAIGAQLDAQRHATGQAAKLENRAATIEAAGDMTVGAVALNNLNGGVTWDMNAGASQHVVQYSVAGDPRRYDASEVLFIGSHVDEPTRPTTDNPTSPGWRTVYQLLLPDPAYPLAQFRNYYLNPPQPSVDYTSQQYHGGDAEGTDVIKVAGQWYSRTDPIWATFGVTPPTADLSDRSPGRLDPNIVVGQGGITSTIDGPSGPIETTYAFDHPVTQAEYDQWQAYRQAHAKLDVAIGKFIESYSGDALGNGKRTYQVWDAYDLDVTTSKPVLTSSAPARIVAGGNMNIAVGAGLNDASQILAGGALTIRGGAIANPDRIVQGSREEHGQLIRSTIKTHTFDSDERIYIPRAYDVVEPTTVALAAGKVEGNQSVAVGHGIGPLSAGQGGSVSTGPGATGGSARVNAIMEVPLAQGGTLVNRGAANGTVNAVSGPAMVVRTSTPNTGLPSASLFSVRSSGTYLVETDPRFASYRQWLSSDYLLTNLGLDPLTTQKRLGDGFYEQRLIREQVAQLTGHRYLSGFTDDEAQYTALMNAGVTFAQKYELRPGVALTAEQMAQLTSDIVWLVAQTVTLADGSTQTVLVPQLYVRVKRGDIDGSGALLSGDSVDIKLSGNAVNGGTIAGRQLVKIDADNIQNLGGRISGAQVQLKATQDIENIGGTIDAAKLLSLDAGRDIKVATTTTQGGSIAASGVNVHIQSIDRIAGLYVSEPGGQLNIKAGQDVILEGAQVQSKGSVDIEAGRDILLGASSTGEQLDARWNKDNTRQSSVTQSMGTTISAQGGNATLHAGRDLKAEAAKLSASDTLQLEAKGAIDLAGVIDQQSAQTYEKRKNGLDYYSLDANSQAQSLNRTELQGSHVQITSGGDTKLAGTTITGDTLDIHAGGKLILPTTSTQDSEGWNMTHGSSGSVGAKGRGSSDQTLNYTQFNIKGATKIQTQGGIEAQVGEGVDLNTLAQQPGMGWVSQITGNPALAGSTEWQRVQEAHEKWAYQQSSMGPVSAALVAVMVGAVAAPAAGAAGTAVGNAAVGMGEGVALGGGGVFLTGTGATISTVAAGAVQAGVLALSSQVGMSFFNNNGDLGKVFKELGSSDSVRNLAAAIVTGGALAGMGFQPLPDQPNVSAGAQQFGQQLINNLQIQGTSALINTAIKGGSFEDALKDALLGALVNSVAATTANAIGDMTGPGKPLDDLTNKVAHAVAGCVMGAAHAGNSGGCAGGAIGTAMGELMAETMGKSPAMDAFYSDQDKVYLAGLLGGLGAALAGGDAQQIQTANWAGSYTAANNYLAHRELEERTQQQIACKGGNGAACTRVKELDALSASRNEDIRAGLASTSEAQNLDIMSNLTSTIKGLVDYKADLEGQLSATSNPTQRADLQNQINLADNNIRQVAALGKDTLSILYQQTGNAEYQSAYQTLQSATSGNDLGGALQDLVLVAAANGRGTPRPPASSTAAGNDGTALDGRASNNFYRDGGVSDPARPMSASGNWRPAAELTPAQADALVNSSLPGGLKIMGSTSAALENSKEVSGGYQAPYIPGSQVIQTSTVEPTSFVRVYVPAADRNNQTGSWMMRAEDIAGLTPVQIASKFGLPQVPTMITDVTVPAGTSMNVSAANGISPGDFKGHYTGGNGGGGGVQFQLTTRPTDPLEFRTWFSNPRSLK